MKRIPLQPRCIHDVIGCFLRRKSRHSSSVVHRVKSFAAVVVLAGCSVYADPFAKGADVSWLPQMEKTGYIFRDREGKKEDCLQVLKDHGIDSIRLRVWADPSDDRQSGHCSPRETVRMAERAQKMGFRIMIDFHYSDSWADPSKQTKPKAWAQHDFSDLQRDVYKHTRDVLTALKKSGVTPEWVQIGNEICDGMLWPDGRASQNPENLARLINEGYRAVKSVDPKIKVIVHIDRGHDQGLYRWFFDLLQENGASYDVIGLSYYPWWIENRQDYHSTIDDLGKNMNALVKRYGKEVMVVETGGKDDQPRETREMLAAVIDKVRAVPDGKGLGVIYWEPQGAFSWSKYVLSCWGSDGRPTEALDAFRESPVKAQK
jgi:arabinogalactan endo-1,4-beta-galactosidase